MLLATVSNFAQYATDSIYYGNDLVDYLAKEFRVPRPSWATSAPPQVPVWGDLLQL